MADFAGNLRVCLITPRIAVDGCINKTGKRRSTYAPPAISATISFSSVAIVSGRLLAWVKTVDGLAETRFRGPWRHLPIVWHYLSPPPQPPCSCAFLRLQAQRVYRAKPCAILRRCAKLSSSRCSSNDNLIVTAGSPMDHFVPGRKTSSNELRDQDPSLNSESPNDVASRRLEFCVDWGCTSFETCVCAKCADPTVMSH